MTPRQTAILATRWRCGSDTDAAAELGIAVSTLKNQLYWLRRLHNARDTMELTYIMRHDIMRWDATERERGRGLRKLEGAA